MMSMNGSAKDTQPYLCCFGQENDDIFLHIITRPNLKRNAPGKRICQDKKCSANKSEEHVIRECNLESICVPICCPEQLQSKCAKTSVANEELKNVKKEDNTFKCNTRRCNHSDISCCDFCCTGVPDGKSFCCYQCRICCKTESKIQPKTQVPPNHCRNKEYTNKVRITNKTSEICVALNSQNCCNNYKNNTDSPVVKNESEPKKKRKSFFPFNFTKMKKGRIYAKAYNNENKEVFQDKQPPNQNAKQPTTQFEDKDDSTCCTCICHCQYKPTLNTRTNCCTRISNRTPKNKEPGNVVANKRTVPQTPFSEFSDATCNRMLKDTQS